MTSTGTARLSERARARGQLPCGHARWAVAQACPVRERLRGPVTAGGAKARAQRPSSDSDAAAAATAPGRRQLEDDAAAGPGPAAEGARWHFKLCYLASPSASVRGPLPVAAPSVTPVTVTVPGST